LDRPGRHDGLDHLQRLIGKATVSRPGRGRSGRALELSRDTIPLTTPPSRHRQTPSPSPRERRGGRLGRTPGDPRSGRDGRRDRKPPRSKINAPAVPEPWGPSIAEPPIPPTESG